MRALKQYASLLLLLTSAAVSDHAEARYLTFPTAQIEITEIKNLGQSAANESLTVIQASWMAQSAPEIKIQGFELHLEVVYADGATQRATAKANGNARSSRFEVPALHRAPGRPAAEMKSFKVSITANWSETTTKQGAL
jgi:hypothetical protein